MDLYTIRQQLNIGIPLTKIPLRVTDYSRVSTTNKLQQTSLKNQVEHFDKMIKDNPNWTYIPGYIDEGITGTSDIKRDNFMQMIEDAKKDKFDLIITKEISRFSRNTLDSIKYTRELLTYGVAVLFVNDNINTALPDSELRLTIMASLAQDEIRRLSERVKFGMNASIKKGNILGNNKLYGYKKDPNTANLVIVNHQAKIIKRIFNLYTIQNKSLTEIAKILKEENIKTNQNKYFSSSTLSRMIRNIKYKGYYCGKKTEVIDYMTKKIKYFPQEEWIIYKNIEKIPPIVNEELWNKANIKINKLAKKTKQSQKKSIYSSLMVCKKHNTLLYRRKQCKKTNDITFLCSIYLKKGKKYCNSPNVRESELNNIFKTIIKQLNTSLVTHILLKFYNQKNDKYLEKYINEKLLSENIFYNILTLLIDKIVVSKEDNTIFLNVKSTYKIPDNITKKYIFTRGKNIKSTKMYNITYLLKFD